jgi:hypothetical protein
MQALSLRNPTSVPVTRVATKVMPTPVVSKMVVAQPVNLRPLGNTVSMTVPNENPFTAGRPIQVLTQASGGMAKPDPQMTSRARFVPGLGGALEDAAYGYFNQYDAQASGMTRAQYDADAGKRQYWENYAKQQNPNLVPKSTDWSKVGDIFTTTVGAASQVTSDMMKARIAAANAQAAQAQAQIERTRQEAFTQRLTDVSKYGEGMAAQKQITIPLLIIAGGALAVAAFLFLKKKKAA